MPAPSWQPAFVFVAEAGSMTVIMLAVSFCMAHARYAHLVLYVIGLSVSLVIAFLRPRSGGSINPARQFGPTAFAGLTPICGSVWSLRFCEWPSGPGCTAFSAVAD
ncbi:aquaporin [Streptomyces chiangmaiensis]|uniref:Aquaporin n=1 Tax=Streptomyces chiangmaiensis TaxID=766497 RepID=A0ABU7FYS0_9ACTN|nr:aquaporin [Streptomyces chiangmaiensis]MED7828249.1 aquaporin [Streptomyces chiangmaiensis]